MLKARNIFYDYPDRQVLRGVSLSLAPGEVLAVLGQNGAGKSTLLRCLAGALSPQGRVEISGRPLADIPPAERARLLAFVPQHVPSRLPMTVFEAVLLGRRPYLSWRPRPQDLEAVWEALALLGLEELAQREFSEISGGQRQKVSLARALAQESRLLVMDEPTSSLDLRHQLEAMTLLCAQARERGTGVILAVHDLNLAARFAHRVILLHNGRVEADGPPGEVLTTQSIRQVYGVEVLRLEAEARAMFFPMSAVNGQA
ncbi:ABC transporter ATP-binding protein [Humidesulfovibrio sp.]